MSTEGQFMDSYLIVGQMARWPERKAQIQTNAGLRFGYTNVIFVEILNLEVAHHIRFVINVTYFWSLKFVLEELFCNSTVFSYISVEIKKEKKPQRPCLYCGACKSDILTHGGRTEDSDHGLDSGYPAPWIF